MKPLLLLELVVVVIGQHILAVCTTVMGAFLPRMAYMLGADAGEVGPGGPMRAEGGGYAFRPQAMAEVWAAILRDHKREDQ